MRVIQIDQQSILNGLRLFVFWASALIFGPIRAECIWEIQGTNGIVYLMGTVHVGRTEQVMSPEIERIYKASDRLAFEVDLDELMSEESQWILLSLALWEPPSSLCDHLSPALCEIVKKYAVDHPDPIFDLLPPETFKPWYLTSLFLIRELERSGLSTEFSWDGMFWKKAGADSKGRMTLETVQFQFDILAGGSLFSQIRALETLLKDTASVIQDNRALLGAWEAGNVEGIRQVLEKDREIEEDDYARLVLHRNTNWVTKIEGWLSETNTTLVVAGTGHFVGLEGVHNLLRGKGYRVERLPRVPSDSPDAQIKAITVTSPSRLNLSLKCQPGLAYTVEESRDLVSWRSLGLTLAKDATPEFQIEASPGQEPQFFRVK